MKRAPRSRQRHDLYAKYHDCDSEISDLLGECGLIRLGRANWKKLSEYHRRSRVEAKMRCLKLLGERIMARDFDRQDAEVQIRIALMNRFTSLGTPQTVRMRWHKPGKRYLRSQSE